MRLLSATSLTLTLLLSTPAFAQQGTAQSGSDDDFHTDQGIVVTAPYVRSLDILGNVSVMQGEKLAQDIRGQIGDTLASQPGVSSSSFSPGASRPILRGFSGERAAVLVDGLGAIDASSTSADHAVSIDPLTADRIEILRGPSVLLFSSQAVGGAVNVFDRRIPRAIPESPAHIDALASYGTAAQDKSIGASIDVPLGQRFVVHADGNYRDSNDVRVGGLIYAPALRAHLLDLAADASAGGDAEEAARLTDAANSRGRVPNSQSTSKSAGVGAAFVDDGGSLGISFGYLEDEYGIPPRADINELPTIKARQYRVDVRGEVNLGDGLFDKLRIRGAYADYAHTEFDDGQPGTRFTNRGIEARAELAQNDRGGWRGASGVQYSFRDFAAIGDEAFLPANETTRLAAFTLQELERGPVTLEGALRFENSKVAASSIGFDRSFDSLSGAAGLSYQLADGLKASVSVSRSERAPSAEELLSDGPHAATLTYERGNPDFAKETSWGGEASLKFARDGWSMGLTGYASWFDNFIYETDTGLIADDLPLFEFRQNKARVWGFEFQGTAPLAQAGGFNFVADATADMTRAKIVDGPYVPRIPPLRIKGGLEAQSDRIDARAEVEWTDDQTRIAPFETATKGFTLVNASLTWRPLPDTKNLSLTLAADNIFDVDARRHASFTKDYVPLAGRDIRITARASF
ncbi:TonB-dependent receptor [Sphingopyxis terrae]|uniref:Iron complex outermembrane recepter protein n=1 Tax=Sphingopyxis terrae subsp. ummariensis TaxID=429001 RepID=A0A1Y6FP16_9SPHN|nr:TonB-dependent receptor [Sphingopyxis terrae]PCF91482.1 TonB-dependent receptor [Sphingopyxis terrae subsp. ummariensis]SMQ76678.1 iron complex outermembrane recepter protein [Sphingopyxis terrae subsp. ummariensis]